MVLKKLILSLAMQMSEHFKFIFEGKYYFQEQRKYCCNMLKLYNEKNMVPFTNVLISVMDAEPKLQKIQLFYCTIIIIKCEGCQAG